MQTTPSFNSYLLNAKIKQMEIMMWFIILFLIWGVFNYRFNWKRANTVQDKYYVTSLFFIFSSIIVYLIYKDFVFKEVQYLIFAFIISLTLAIFFSTYYPYYKHIRNGRYFLISLTFDILFQQIMVVIGVKILSQYFGANYSNIYFGIAFALTHFPVIFFKWAKMRYLYVVLAFFGGILFSYAIINYGAVGICLSFILHFILYIIFFYKLRDERKI